MIDYFVIWKIYLLIIAGFLATYFVFGLTRKSYMADDEARWKASSILTGCSINVLKYGFNNSVGKIIKNESELRLGDCIQKILISRLQYRESFDTEILISSQQSRHELQESIIIIQNITGGINHHYAIIYYCVKIGWIISLILSFLTFGLSLICKIFVSFYTSRSYSFSVIIRSLQQQSMESLGFEKSFDAFSRDPVEARMIITPAFMDRLEEFSNKWNLHGKIRIIWEKDTFTLLLKGDIEKYGKESDGSYTLVKSMGELLDLGYYSLPQK